MYAPACFVLILYFVLRQSGAVCSVKTQNGEDRLISTTGEKTLNAEAAVFVKAMQSVFEVGFQTPLYRDDSESRWGSGVDGSTVVIGIKGASCWNLMVCPSPVAASVLAGKFFQTGAADVSVALEEEGRRPACGQSLGSTRRANDRGFADSRDGF